MLKQKEYNIAETNIANLGSDLEKSVREAAARNEKAWTEAGQKPGLEIWRIEKFQVVAWPKDQYGKFYDGDSYIILNTYKKKDTDALAWDVHFWLGEHTSQDEAGTAAYKTVELDDFLRGAPVQHREVQGHESALFLSYFRDQITILKGGIDSGFRKVEAVTYQTRLLQLKGKKKVRVTEVPLSCDSLNSGDVFILDAGLNIYQWNGNKSSPFERSKGASLSRALDDERQGKATVHVMGETDTEPKEFWAALGGKKAIKSAAEGGSDDDVKLDKKLYRLSDASGKLEFQLVGSGAQIKRSMLDSSDVFIMDTGAEVFAWIGKGASKEEKTKAMQYATQYLTNNKRPAYTPVARVLEGGENEVFENSFH